MRTPRSAKHLSLVGMCAWACSGICYVLLLLILFGWFLVDYVSVPSSTGADPIPPPLLCNLTALVSPDDLTSPQAWMDLLAKAVPSWSGEQVQWLASGELLDRTVTHLWATGVLSLINLVGLGWSWARFRWLSQQRRRRDRMHRYVVPFTQPVILLSHSLYVISSRHVSPAQLALLMLSFLLATLHWFLFWWLLPQWSQTEEGQKADRAERDALRQAVFSKPIVGSAATESTARHIALTARALNVQYRWTWTAYAIVAWFVWNLGCSVQAVTGYSRSLIPPDLLAEMNLGCVRGLPPRCWAQPWTNTSNETVAAVDFPDEALPRLVWVIADGLGEIPWHAHRQVSPPSDDRWVAMSATVLASNPTFSVPNWLTLVSGAPPFVTGVVGNLQVHDRHWETIFHVASLHDNLALPPHHGVVMERVTRALSAHTEFAVLLGPTLADGRLTFVYDAPHPFTCLSADRFDRQPPRTDPREIFLHQGASVTTVDAWRTRAALASILPRAADTNTSVGAQLTLVHWDQADLAGHFFGASSAQAEVALANIEHQLGHLLDTMQEAGELDLAHLRTANPSHSPNLTTISSGALLFTADHGHVAEGGHGGTEIHVQRVPAEVWIERRVLDERNSSFRSACYQSLGLTVHATFPGPIQRNTAVAASAAVALGLLTPLQSLSPPDWHLVCSLADGARAAPTPEWMAQSVLNAAWGRLCMARSAWILAGVGSGGVDDNMRVWHTRIMDAQRTWLQYLWQTRLAPGGASTPPPWIVATPPSAGQMRTDLLEPLDRIVQDAFDQITTTALVRNILYMVFLVVGIASGLLYRFQLYSLVPITTRKRSGTADTLSDGSRREAWVWWRMLNASRAPLYSFLMLLVYTTLSIVVYVIVFNGWYGYGGWSATHVHHPKMMIPALATLLIPGTIIVFVALRIIYWQALAWATSAPGEVHLGIATSRAGSSFWDQSWLFCVRIWQIIFLEYDIFTQRITDWSFVWSMRQYLLLQTALLALVLLILHSPIGISTPPAHTLLLEGDIAWTYYFRLLVIEVMYLPWMFGVLVHVWLWPTWLGPASSYATKKTPLAQLAESASEAAAGPSDDLDSRQSTEHDYSSGRRHRNDSEETAPLFTQRYI